MRLYRWKCRVMKYKLDFLQETVDSMIKPML